MKLSIITINYNNSIGLEKTINSVINQTVKCYEYIIIDGGSTDDSINIIKLYNDKITYWISEPDSGIYNAMNKGIKKASGDFLLFLNSGDWLSDNNSLVKLLQDYPEEYDIVYCNWYLHYSNDNIVEDKFPNIITFYFLAFQYSLPHQATIIKRTFLVEHGAYDESLRMVSDWKFFLEAIFKWQCKYLHKPIFLSYYNKDGFSSNPKNEELQKIERKKVLSESFSNFLYIKEEIEVYENKVWHYNNSRLINFLKFIKLVRFIFCICLLF